jgi:hypothetical protein
MDSELSQINIEVSASDATEEDIDRMTRQLLAEVRELPVESAELTMGESAPEGSKGDPVTLGSLVVSSLPTVLPAVVALVQSWSSRGSGRTVKFKGKIGREMIEFEGSAADLHRLLETLSRGKKL